MTREELAERLEGVECGSRELSNEVLYACGWERQAAGPAQVVWEKAPGYVAPESFSPTESLDAALFLVPEGWLVRKLAQWPEEWSCVLVKGAGLATAKGATPALALCAAVLRAQAQEKDHG